MCSLYADIRPLRPVEMRSSGRLGVSEPHPGARGPGSRQADAVLRKLQSSLYRKFETIPRARARPKLHPDDHRARREPRAADNKPHNLRCRFGVRPRPDPRTALRPHRKTDRTLRRGLCFFSRPPHNATRRRLVQSKTVLRARQGLDPEPAKGFVFGSSQRNTHFYEIFHARSVA
jgi:hypothetical protein